MKVLLVNPPNCGRSIPEEKYGIGSYKQIFRGEPLSLETLAGGLDRHEVAIVDLKADPHGYLPALESFRPGLVGITGVTCEANAVLGLAGQARKTGAAVVVGGIHASADPAFFDRPSIDLVVAGLGKRILREVADRLEEGSDVSTIPHLAVTPRKHNLLLRSTAPGREDLAEGLPARYDLVEAHRASYRLESLGLELGMVAASFGCPYDCAFCCVSRLTGGRYLTREPAEVIADMRGLPGPPVVRLVDANAFGDPRRARGLARAVREAGIRKSFIADVRADAVVRNPEVIREWKESGLRSVVIGFEEVSDGALAGLGKHASVEANREAGAILRGMGITVVGDFIVSPDYGEKEFAALEDHLAANPVDLPIFSILTPLPGTALNRRLRERIRIDDLDFYTLTNAVTDTRLPEREFYGLFARLAGAFQEKGRV